MTGKDLRTIRETYGLTQIQFARAINVQSQTVSNWENGSFEPSGYHLLIYYRLAHFMNNQLQRQRIQEALFKAQGLPPVPPKWASHLDDAFKAGAFAFGLAVIFEALFSNSSPGRSSKIGKSQGKRGRK